MKFAFATSVVQHELGAKNITIMAGVLEASNRYEAEGQALAIARKLYPISKGFSEHFAAIGDGEAIMTPENAILIKS